MHFSTPPPLQAIAGHGHLRSRFSARLIQWGIIRRLTDLPAPVAQPLNLRPACCKGCKGCKRRPTARASRAADLVRTKFAGPNLLFMAFYSWPLAASSCCH
eukprot:291754-Pelagomonas_calceolata.AAC.2